MSDAGESSEQEQVDAGIEDANVVTKYKAASDIANAAATGVMAAGVAGKSILELCVEGDAVITAGVAGLYNKKVDGKVMDKGIAFPTCVSVNNCVCAFSPLNEAGALKDGDVVKVDLGVHIDGYVSTLAHTFVVGATAEAPVTGATGDVVCAARMGVEAMLRMCADGGTNEDCPPILAKIAEAYGVELVEGVLSHEMKRFVMDGNNCILAKPSIEQQVDKINFVTGEVYHIDVAMSTGAGKPKVLDEKQTTVYKRAVENEHQLKMKASRETLFEVNARFPSMPFTLRALAEVGKARLGITEMVEHELVYAYPVLYEKEGDIVAHFKYTILLMPNGTLKISGLDAPFASSEKKCEDEDVLKVMSKSMAKKKKKRNKKKKGGAAAAGGKAKAEA